MLSTLDFDPTVKCSLSLSLYRDILPIHFSSGEEVFLWTVILSIPDLYVCPIYTLVQLLHEILCTACDSDFILGNLFMIKTVLFPILIFPSGLKMRVRCDVIPFIQLNGINPLFELLCMFIKKSETRHFCNMGKTSRKRKIKRPNF